MEIPATGNTGILMMHADTVIQPNIISSPQMDFAQQYISMRRAEGRLFSDDQVRRLPDVTSTKTKAEWSARKFSCDQLVHYLARKSCPLKILEVGCGNGWLSHRLSQIKDVDVIGMDVNDTELQQARRVFEKTNRLSFTYGELRQLDAHHKYDVIVFASAIQYFPSFGNIMHAALDHLAPNGEIHILDTHIYETQRIHEARERSAAYFRQIGFENMARFYFHHSFEDLENFNYRFLYKPAKWMNRLKRKNPFPWICIKSAR